MLDIVQQSLHRDHSGDLKRFGQNGGMGSYPARRESNATKMVPL